MTQHRDRLRRIGELARSVSSALELETVLAQITAAVGGLRPGLVGVIRVVDPAAGGYRVVGTPGQAFGEALTHRIAETREPVVVGDDYGVPIDAGDDLLGALLVRVPSGPPLDGDEREIIELGAAHAAVALRSARLVAATEARRRTAEALASLGRILSQTLDPDIVAGRIADNLCTLLGARSSLLFRLDADSGDLVAIARAGIDAAASPRMVLPEGVGLAALAVRGRAPVVSRDVTADPRVTLTPDVREQIERGPHRSVLSVPLILGERVVGVLSVGDVPGRDFGIEEIGLAQAFADQAAVALENARLYDEATRERRRLAVLYDVSARVAAAQDTDKILALIAEEAVRLLDADAAGLRLLEGDELVLRARTESAAGLITRARIRVGESLSGIPVATGEACTVEDIITDTRYDPVHKQAAQDLGYHSFLGVPLRAHGRVLGSLYVYTRTRRRFRPDEISLLSAFADHASLAIDKDRLLGEANDRAARLRTLARLGRIVSSSLDIDTVLGGIARAATQLMDAPLIAFWIADAPTRMLTVGAFSDRRLGADYPVKSLRFGQDLVGWIATHGRPVNVADVRDDERFLARAWARGHGLSSFLGVPITFRDSVLGVLTMLGHAPFRLGAEEQGLLESFAAQAALAIRNARVYEELRVAHENLERSQEQLIHSEKLSALGQLVAGVAHELNNPLSAVLGHAYLAETKTDAGALETHIRGMREGAERAAQIVRNLLQFARKTGSSRDAVDVNSLVDQAIELTVNAGATQNVSVVRDLEPGLPLTAGDPGQLQQVLLNLVANAYQAMADGGVLTVRTRPAGRRLRLEVSDSGPGVPADIRHKIFDPFFTTKPVGEGTGLGLSVAHGIVSAHGGRLWLDEHAAPGATFVIELPLAAPQAAPAADDEAVVRPGCRLLVVDDEPPVANVLGALLEEIGAKVVIVHSAQEARQALERETFDAITLDLVMPGENGVEFWRWLLQERPAAARRVIFVTGNVDPTMREFADASGCPLLAKPYTLRGLRETLAARLAR